MDGSYDHNDLGIENPTPSHDAIHDTTDQDKAFVYVSRILSDTSRVSLMGSASYSNFQVPNTPGLPLGTAPDGSTRGIPRSGLPANFDSPTLNENQNEQNYYGVATYQKSAGDLNFQVSVFGRNSNVHFSPDPIGDLYFNGVASDVARNLYSGGIQADASYALGDKHTIRGGVMAAGRICYRRLDNYGLSGGRRRKSNARPRRRDVSHHAKRTCSHGLFAGVYLQDEWKILPEVTVNYGARFDEFYSTFDKENQPSPRANVIYQPTDSTTLHAGYARYFTPPPLENVPAATWRIRRHVRTPRPTDADQSVKAERANYFDAGISQKWRQASASRRGRLLQERHEPAR